MALLEAMMVRISARQQSPSVFRACKTRKRKLTTLYAFELTSWCRSKLELRVFGPHGDLQQKSTNVCTSIWTDRVNTSVARALSDVGSLRCCLLTIQSIFPQRSSAFAHPLTYSPTLSKATQLLHQIDINRKHSSTAHLCGRPEASKQ